MKKILIVAAMLASLGAYAQGTVNFNNFVLSSGVNAPVFDVNGTTKLAGAGFQAQLFGGPNAGSLAAVGDSVPFRSGAAAGYFTGGSRTIPGGAAGIGAGGNASLQVRAWEGAAGSTFAAAGKKGQSVVFTNPTGDPTASPPGTPKDLTGLGTQSFSIVPEPSTIALGALGALALLFRRRK